LNGKGGRPPDLFDEGEEHVSDFEEDDLKPPRKAAEKVSLAKVALRRAQELLPKGTAAAGERRATHSPLRLSRRGEQPRVLLVDDDEVVRRLMVKVIEGKGMSCTAVASAEDAIPVMEQELFDALVLDKNLPGMDGVELAGLARRIQPGVPVLMITGYSSEESASQAAAYGVTDYILKPIDLTEFRARLTQVLAAGPSEPPPAASPSRPARPARTSRVPEEAAEQPAEAEAASRSVAVLLVEPEHTMRGKLEAALRPLGCNIASFSEPGQVRLEVGKHPFEVLVAPPDVLTDSRSWQEGAVGWRLLGRIAIMDRGGVDRTIEAIHLGARGVVHPPFDPSETAAEFRRVVDALLEERLG
jgi:DNA-binding response OmpR family regulator